MIAIIVVTVVLHGLPIAALQPAYVKDGAVFAPLQPVVSEIARSTSVDGRDITVRRGDRVVRLRIGRDAYELDDGTIYVRLAHVVQGLGGSVNYDPVRRVAAIVMPATETVSTPGPYERTAPTVAPTAVFTPQPTVTPRPTPSGTPRPRRTPLPVVPSYPAPVQT
ncbi:MAG: hypothetical protein ACRENA_04320 [Vulcanimicrobiaceae bacterium]